MRAVLDTNILIDYLNGIEAARDEIARYDAPMISVITWMEVMIGSAPEENELVRGFLNRFELKGLDQTVAERAVEVRRERRIRLPDAITQATALTENALLVTRNIKDFPPDDPGVRMPYQI